MQLSLRGFPILMAVCAAALLSMMAPDTALAALIVVDNTEDFPDADPGDGVCRGRLVYSLTKRCSLRAAIQEANANPGIDNIVLEGKTYDVSHDPEVSTEGGPPIIRTSMTITGVGRASTIIDQGAGSAAWRVESGTVRFIGLTISRGSGLLIFPAATAFVTSAGIDRSDQAGINNNRGTVTVSNSTITGSRSDGGVVNTGNMIIDTTSITGNHLNAFSAGTGGGITNSGSLFVTASLIASNVSDRALGAGGIQNQGNLFVSNTTISGNSVVLGDVRGAGGASLSIGLLTFVNVTVANNTGVGMNRTGGSIGIFQSTLLTNNSGGNCAGTITISTDPLQQQNLDSGNTCAFTFGTNLSNVDPKIQPLANNGGPTQTHGLPLDSPAVDVAACPLNTDQRGVTRPLNGDFNPLTLCDIGAFERTPPFGGGIPGVGTGGLSPSSASIGAGQTTTETVTWDVPSPGFWTALTTIDARLRGTGGIVLWVRWDQTTNLFQLLDANGQPVGPQFPGGTPYSPGSNGVSLDLAGTEGKGSGATGQRATLTLPLSFTEALAGQTFGVEVAASSDFDASEAFRQVGTISVSAAATSSVVSPGDDGGRVKQEQDDRPRLSEDQRRHRERTNQGGRDQYATEGNVIAVRCDADIPTVTIANRDGEVAVRLVKEAASACASIRVGDYLEADGEKQSEQLFEADSISVSRVH